MSDGGADNSRMEEGRPSRDTPPGIPVLMQKDAFGGILGCDETCLPVLGWEREHLVGARSLDYIHPDDHDDAIARWMSMLEEPGHELVSRYRHLHVSGAWLDVEITNVNTLDTLGSVTSSLVALGWSVEIGAHVVPGGSSELRALHKIRSGERLLRRLAEWLPTGVVYVDGGGTVTYANSQARSLLGVDDGCPADLLFATLDESGAVEAGRSLGRILGTDADALVTATSKDPALGTRFLQIALRGLADGPDGPAGLVVSVEDATERIRARAELERRASTDPLTGCLNRGAFIDELGGVHRRGERFVLAFVDVDRLKSQNDTLGHAGGDVLLIEMADHLRNALRPGDVVGRMGGDEFVAICRGIDNQEGALAITQRIAASMTWVFDAGSLTFPVSASVGATLVDPTTGIAQALARADHAMYAAKRSRSEGGVLWDESLPPVTDNRVADDLALWDIAASRGN
jgi:diguanylate cyclase (GGDEF)-like protein